MKRKASAVWQGDLKSGKGSISTESGTLKKTQFDESPRGLGIIKGYRKYPSSFSDE